MRPGPLPLLLALAACSPGPGRDPAFPDAARPADAVVEDARPIADLGPPPDAGPSDAAIALFDAGPPPAYPFNGVFGIEGQSGVLYAREVGSRLMLIVDRHPFVYTGTITVAGEVDVRSLVLARSGCMEARITGRYDRALAFHSLTHRACSVADGRPFAASIRGGFARDFAASLSGQYELSAMVVADANGCFGARGPFMVRYAFNFDGTQVAVYTAYDVIAESMVYLGRADPGGDFSAIAQALAQSSGLDVAMHGRFEQATALDPPRFVGERDAIDARTGCAFRMVLDGRRVAGP